MIRVILDNTLVTNPDSWKELVSKLKREDQYNALLLYQETELIFNDEAYDYLYQKLLADGYCSVIDCIIQESCDEGASWTQLIKGRIFLSDVKFNERICTAQVKIEDQSFFALIKNNLKIKTAINGRESKNLLDISSVIPQTYWVDFYDVATNVAIQATIPCVRVYDAFKYLIAFVSDNEIGFESSLFGDGGKWAGLSITTGKRLSTTNEEQITQFSLDELYTEIMNVTEPLIMILEDPYGSPKIRIENMDYTYTSNIIATMNDVYEINTSVDEQKIYTNVKLGSSTLNDAPALPFPENINILGFKQEQVYLVGQCNIDNDLDLSGDWVRSNNVIEDILYLSSDSYDDEIFLIETIRDTLTSYTGRTTNVNYFGISPAVYYYNTGLINNEILNRYVGGIPNSASSIYGDTQDGKFYAVYIPRTINYTIDEFQFSYDNEINDYGNDYNPITSTFTAPQAGVYSIYASAYLGNFSWSTNGQEVEVDFFLRYYDSSNNPIGYVLLDNGNTDNVYSPPNSQISLSGGRTQKMNQGDYVQVWVRLSSFNNNANLVSFDILPTGVFTCYYNTNGGGLIVPKDPKNYPILVHEFEYPLSPSEWQNIISNPLGKIAFKMNKQDTRTAWIDEIVYEHFSKTAKIKLITATNAN
jgi:hypothetical protein